MILDLFAGPGGWSEGLRQIGPPRLAAHIIGALLGIEVTPETPEDMPA